MYKTVSQLVRVHNNTSIVMYDNIADISKLSVIIIIKEVQWKCLLLSEVTLYQFLNTPLHSVMHKN